MTDQDYIAEHAAQCDADEREFHEAGLRALGDDHAAEVKRLTAELAEARAGEAKAKREGVEAIQWMVEQSAEMKRLTARVAELESGSAFVGEELRSRPERDEHYGFYWAQSSRGGPELELSHTDEASIPECHDWMRAFAYTGPTTAPIPSPLPTAGDDACEVNPIVSRMCERGTKCCTVEHAPAEPDCPAEEQPSKLRDESWLREAADAEDQHASVCAGDMTPRKPVCLDGVPAVLCEHECRNERYWVYGPISDGWVAAWSVKPDGDRHTCLMAAEFLTPIHHDPTDAAAVELAGRIERGGNDAQ